MPPHRNAGRESRAAARIAAKLLPLDAGEMTLEVAGALGDFVLHRWMKDNSDDSARKVERLLDALGAHPEVAEKDIEMYIRARADQSLAPKERRLLYLLSIGFAPKQVALIDGVKEDTIKDRLRDCRTKLRAANTTHAVALAIRRELI